MQVKTFSILIFFMKTAASRITPVVEPLGVMSVTIKSFVLPPDVI